MVSQNQLKIPQEPVETPFGEFLWGEEKFVRRKSILAALRKNPVFSKTLGASAELARKDVWALAALQSRELVKLKLTQGWSHTMFQEAINFLEQPVQVSPQFRIFFSNLERQMSDEQKAIWIPRVERCEILGSYSQTELGHGSNVRGIETTATYDVDKDEFIIHSPTLSSTKYWIGVAGIWATHTLVVARLIIKGTDYGNHVFLVQIRDLQTHAPLEGVSLYDLGPKAFHGMLGFDNGALRFHNVRIPRSQMLARNAQVSRSGTYTAPDNSKHSYGSMVTVRALMAELTGWDLLKPVVVAYHYTKFRKQFSKDGGKGPETTVFDYASVRYRLVPLLAKATAMVLVGREIKRAYDAYTAKNLASGSTSELEDLHLRTVGAKVWSTEITARGIETCRIACGGHGYSALAGFGRMYANAVNAITYEGDNYVIGQQIPKAIMKHLRKKTPELPPCLSYLSALDNPSGEGQGVQIDSVAAWLDHSNQRRVLEQRLTSLIRDHLNDLEQGQDTSYSSHSFTMAHCDLVYWEGLKKVVDQAEAANEPFASALKSLSQVFSLSLLQDPHHPSLVPSSLSPSERRLLKTAYSQVLLDFAAEHMDSVVDAYGFTEYELDSALARTNQTPYEALFEGAERSELSGERMQHLYPLILETRGLWKGFIPKRQSQTSRL